MLMRVDGHHAPDSTVLRALGRSGRVKARARLARLHHAEPARRDRDGRTGDHRDPAAWRPSAQRAARETGEIRPIALVTDNGSCFKAARLAAFIEKRPEPIHIRTPRKSPNQKRRQGARLRPPQVRAPVPARDRRRLSAWPRRRDLPAALQHDPAARSARHAPPARPPPRSDQRPPDHQVNRARNPATFVTRDRTAKPRTEARAARATSRLVRQAARFYKSGRRTQLVPVADHNVG